VVATPIEDLAPRSEDEVREHLKSGKLVEGLQHMSPQYLHGIRRILTVSADTEFVSAPGLPARGQHAPALNNFGSRCRSCQDELAHAPHRLPACSATSASTWTR
jgi:ring-1,2-phenylacetyl-CoA epoxidase subunit PaaA